MEGSAGVQGVSRASIRRGAAVWGRPPTALAWAHVSNACGARARHRRWFRSRRLVSSLWDQPLPGYLAAYPNLPESTPHCVLCTVHTLLSFAEERCASTINCNCVCTH